MSLNGTENFNLMKSAKNKTFYSLTTLRRREAGHEHRKSI
jgi:hypothetical protein